MGTKQLVLRDYQKELSGQGAAILTKFGIVYFSMEMRTGKTAVALTTCHINRYKRVLMISKKKALGSLEADNEATKYGFDFLCTNFEQIHNIDFDPDVVIIDEAHSLGQFPKPAVRTKRLKEICEGKPIIYLSGTPTPESYSQLYHQFWISSFSPWGNYPSFYKWAADYVSIKNKYLGQIVIKDYSAAFQDKIKKDTEHLFISYTQKEAGFKQEIQEKFITVNMKDSTWWLFDKLKKDKVYVGKEKDVVLADTAVKLMSKLHQVSSGTVILEEVPGEERSKEMELAKVFDTSKAEYIKEHYKGKKIAIYYKFRAEYMAILATFGFDRLTEDQTVFNTTDDRIIFVSQIQSGREGVDLRSADYLLMYNIDFSAVSYFQVRARSQSMDRDKEAAIHWLFSDKGIEHKVYKAVSNKKDYTLSYFKKDYAL